MARLILSRIGMAVPVLFIMTVLTFALVSLIPGNAATSILGQDATPAKVAALNAQLGLDQPLPTQYWMWLQKAFFGNFGTSLYSGTDVTRLIGQRIMPTLYVAGFATLAAAVIGVSIGVYAALRRGWIARALDILGMLGISLPNFWIALLLATFVGGQLGWFPTLGYTAPEVSVAEWVSHLVLPVTALALAGVAIIAKQSRDAMAEALSRDFMRFMQANGISRRSLIFRHGLRYAAVPIVSAAAASFINLFGGTVALESVFALPGLGSLVATSTLRHDLTTIQGAVLVYTVVILAVTLLSDVLYALLNPKVLAR